VYPGIVLDLLLKIGSELLIAFVGHYRSRDMPRQTTVLPGGGSWVRARYPRQPEDGRYGDAGPGEP
jgi:hypothetical protein